MPGRSRVRKLSAPCLQCTDLSCCKQQQQQQQLCCRQCVKDRASNIKINERRRRSSSVQWLRSL